MIMGESLEGDARYDRPLARDPDSALSSEEVRVLWDFVHGDIMSGPTRARLREYWGMCARHAWAYAVVEIELWEAGAGARGGHQPFDLTILYTDLLHTMVDRLRSARRHRRAAVLEQHGGCVICADVRGGAPPGILVTHAGLDLAQLTVEANRMRFTEEWLLETQPQWAGVVCPDCAAAVGVSTAGLSRCRAHLLAAGTFTDEGWEQARTMLAELVVQVQALTDSMTQSGIAATDEVNASWVKAVSWFIGWDFPLTLTRSRQRNQD